MRRHRRTRNPDLPSEVGSISTVATGARDHGEIVGIYEHSTGAIHGFAGHGGTFTTIDVPGVRGTDANGVSDHSQFVGIYAIDNEAVFHGFESARRASRPRRARLRRARSVPAARGVITLLATGEVR